MEMGMARQKRSYSQEYRDEAVKMVIETSRPVAVVARELGLLDGTLGNWVNAYRKSHSVEGQPLATSATCCGLLSCGAAGWRPSAPSSGRVRWSPGPAR
jgi:transposase-like protein